MTRLTPVILGICLLNVSMGGRSAGNGNGDANFDFQVPPEARHQIARNLWFGSDIVTTVEYTDDYDLNAASDDYLLSVEPEIRAVLSYTPSAKVQLYGEFQIDGRGFLSKGPDNDETSEESLRIEQLYIDLPQLARDTSARIGRQRFKDGRTWWYDEKIDAVKVDWSRKQWFVGAAAAREKLYPDDLLRGDTDEQVDFFVVTAGYAAGKRNQTTLFLVKKNDHESRHHEDPLFIGIQRLGEAGADTRYWLNAAAVRGSSRGRNLHAYGADGGVSLRFDGDWRPFVTLAMAYGSGDDQPGDSVDRDFRQTGLQENEARTYGITNYRFYGEVFNPELSNMWIGTLGVGIRPNGATSAELLYHRYRQVNRRNELFDTDLDIDPHGDHKDLGQELDLIVGHRPNEKIKLSLTLGMFLPGDAYGSDSDPALLAKIKFAYRF